LFEWKNFYYILNVEIPKTFPTGQPKLTFQSIYHLHNEKPFTTMKDTYPYSPRWSVEELIERTRTFIISYLPTFQNTSIRNIK